MKNKTFIDLYQDAKSQRPTITPAKQFINEVMDVTQKSEVTVYNWLSGRQTPDRLVVEILAKHFKVDPDGLFPVAKE